MINACHIKIIKTLRLLLPLNHKKEDNQGWVFLGMRKGRKSTAKMSNKFEISVCCLYFFTPFVLRFLCTHKTQ